MKSPLKVMSKPAVKKIHNINALFERNYRKPKSAKIAMKKICTVHAPNKDAVKGPNSVEKL